jgi:hypothetical protein
VGEIIRVVEYDDPEEQVRKLACCWYKTEVWTVSCAYKSFIQ